MATFRVAGSGDRQRSLLCYFVYSCQKLSSSGPTAKVNLIARTGGFNRASGFAIQTVLLRRFGRHHHNPTAAAVAAAAPKKHAPQSKRAGLFGARNTTERTGTALTMRTCANGEAHLKSNNYRSH